MHKLKDNKIVDCLVRSRVPMYEYNFKWILEDYSRIKNDKSFSSPHFHPEVGCSWCVNICKNTTYFTLHLYRSGGHGEVQLQCEVTVAGCNGNIWKKGDITSNFENAEKSITIISQLVLKVEEVKNKYNDAIEVILQLKIYKMNTNQLDSTVQYCFSSEETFQRDVQKSLTEDLARFYESPLSTDIILSIEGETLGVHKAILSARSSVFAKMFQQEMKESTNNVVVIEDVAMAAMKEVVAFIYGKAKREYCYDTAVEVYYAADKYDIKKLRDICGGILASQFNEGNAGPILTIADQHRDFILKEKAMKFIIFNLKSCVKTKWWSNLMSIRSELATELSVFIADFK